jgi:Protein of unknown function (DUF2490)
MNSTVFFVYRMLKAIVFTTFFCNCAYAQTLCCVQGKDIEMNDQTWFGYFNQTRFTKHSGLWADLHLRFSGNFLDEKFLTISRIGYTYYASSLRITAGYAHATYYAIETSTPQVVEHRPWQQVQWGGKKGRFTVAQWIRLEERFRQEVEKGALTGNYNFNYRIRYSMAFTIPLRANSWAEQMPFLFFNNEVFVNFGKEITINYFDQNRILAGFGYQLNPNLNVKLGYMYLFQQLATPNQYLQINAIRLSVFHNLDFTKSND